MDRRHFLQLAASAAAGVALHPGRLEAGGASVLTPEDLRYQGLFKLPIDDPYGAKTRFGYSLGSLAIRRVAGELRIFFQIVLPTLKPILVTLAIFAFLGAWNDFMWPLIVLGDQSMQTLPVALATLSREHVQDNELMMAGAVVTVIPVLVLFLVLQRYYLQGLLVGSVKG